MHIKINSFEFEGSLTGGYLCIPYIGEAYINGRDSCFDTWNSIKKKQREWREQEPQAVNLEG